MAHITKRILYSSSDKCLVGYVVEKDGVESWIEIVKLIDMISSGVLKVDNAKVVKGRYDYVYTLRGINCALSRLPVVYADKRQ